MKTHVRHASSLAMLLSVCCIMVVVGCGGSTRHAGSTTGLQQRVKACMQDGEAGSSADPDSMYADCMAAYDSMKATPRDDPHFHDAMLTAGVTALYAAYADSREGRSSEAAALARGGKQLIAVAATSADPDVRERALRMNACLIDGDHTKC